MKTVQSNGGKLTPTTISIPFIAVGHCLCLHFVTKYVFLPLFQMDYTSDEGRSTIVSCTFGNSGEFILYIISLCYIYVFIVILTIYIFPRHPTICFIKGVIPLIFAEALFRHDAFILQKAYSFVSLYLLGWSPLFWSLGRSSLIGRSNSNSGVGVENFDDIDIDAPPLLLTTLINQIKSMKMLLPPPVMGIFVGLVASSISFLRRLFMEQKAPLSAVYNCLNNLGRAANPLALLVLTASLALGTVKSATTSSSGASSGISTTASIASPSDENSNGASLLQRLSCVSVVRFIVSPLLMAIILNYVFGSISHDNKDLAMIWFIMIMESTMPPAQNSVLMLQVAEKTQEASKLAKFLFSMYITSMLPIVIIATFLLEKCGLTQY